MLLFQKQNPLDKLSLFFVVGFFGIFYLTELKLNFCYSHKNILRYILK